MTPPLETVELITGRDPDCSVIWLHGLGAEGNDFEPMLAALRLENSVRFVFPSAPVRRISANPALVVRAWYDVLAVDLVSQEDATSIRAGEAAIGAIVEREIDRGVASDRILLGGFSQGAALALYTALRFPRKLAGILVLSGYLPLRETVAAQRSLANAQTPIFMAHGSEDTVVPHTLAHDSRRSLESLGYAIDWRSYPMAHMVCGSEVKDISRWMNARFTPAVQDQSGDKEALDRTGETR